MFRFEHKCNFECYTSSCARNTLIHTYTHIEVDKSSVARLKKYFFLSIANIIVSGFDLQQLTVYFLFLPFAFWLFLPQLMLFSFSIFAYLNQIIFHMQKQNTGLWAHPRKANLSRRDTNQDSLLFYLFSMFTNLNQIIFRMQNQNTGLWDHPRKNNLSRADSSQDSLLLGWNRALCDAFIWTLWEVEVHSVYV